MKKEVKYNKATDGYECPSCDEEIDHYDSYCRYCGQELSWNDIDKLDEEILNYEKKV